MRRVVCARLHHIGGDQFAFAADRDGDPVELRAALPGGQQEKAASGQLLAVQTIGDVGDGNHAAAPEDDTFDGRRFVGKAEDAARRDELGDLGSGQSEPAFSQAEKNERLHDFDDGGGSGGHWMSAPEVSAAMARVSAASCADSSRVSSASERKPSGCTTGMTA